MKAIIDGKRYDTATATLIGGIGSDTSDPGDFAWWSANLYKTRRGAFFIEGEGGPRSPFVTSHGQNQWSGGSGIRSLTAEDALYHAERILIPECLEEHFEIEDA